eukprot:6997961-Ditylum_brightwellii.AAC.1
MDNNKAVIVSLGYGTYVAIYSALVSVFHEGSGLRFQATILVEGCDRNRVFYHARWVTRSPGVRVWQAMVPRHLARRIIMM